MPVPVLFGMKEYWDFSQTGLKTRKLFVNSTAHWHLHHNCTTNFTIIIDCPTPVYNFACLLPWAYVMLIKQTSAAQCVGIFGIMESVCLHLCTFASLHLCSPLGVGFPPLLTFSLVATTGSPCMMIQQNETLMMHILMASTSLECFHFFETFAFTLELLRYSCLSTVL